MTTSLGIAATTAVLRQLLQNAIPSAQLFNVLGNVAVTALPPDRIDVGSESSTLNLFMYQVRPNTGWTNAEYPSHDAAGRRLTNPPLALDLSYLLSAYGAENFHGEILLGYGALVLHQTRVLTRDAVKATFAGGALSADLALLATSGLDGQEELVSLSMESLSTEELSRLWSVFGEKYRPSIAFQATVVLLRGADPAIASGPPVVRARLGTTTSISPTIAGIEPATVIAGPGATVDLVGTGLLTPDTVVRFGSGQWEDPANGSTSLRVRVRLPETLRAGVNTVRIQQPMRFEDGVRLPPPSPPGGDLRGGPESNVAPFTLRPAFELGAGSRPDILIGPRSGTGQVTSTTITARLMPAVDKRQNVSLLLTQTGLPAGAAPRSYAIPARSREKDDDETTDTVVFTVSSVLRSRYLVRVRVDGAETELRMTAGVYDRPSLDLS